MYKEIIEQMEANMQSSPDDYTKDGLLYCGKCNTPKQKYVEFFKRNMPIMCRCREEEVKRQEELERLIKKQEQIEKLRKASLLGEKYKGVTFDNTETGHSKDFKAIYDRCKKYCDVSTDVLEKGIGIYLFGTKGTGKSRLTACMGNELMNKNYTVLYTNFADISKNILNSKEDFIEQLGRIEFLFIDDFGTEKVTKNNEDMWLQGKVFEVINKRYINNKPIIFTSNYSLEELIRDRGIADKTVDRIMEICEIMKLEGKSYRMTKAKQRERLF